MKYSNARKIRGVLTMPVVTLVVLYIICVANGTSMFAGSSSVLFFIRSTTSIVLTAMALSVNFTSGRFDFSIGAVSMLASVVSATIALQLDMGPWMMLLTGIVIGALLGIVSGGVYCITRIPPIITGLGMTLFFEGAAFTFTGGKGVTIVTKNNLIGFSSSILNYLIVMAVALVFVILLYDYTRFGAEYRALKTGQKIACETGIKEVPNALVCYAVAGALMGAVGFISITNNGTARVSLNFGSITFMMNAFLPMFIGGYLSRYVSEWIGILAGSVVNALIYLAFARLNTTTSVQSIVTALVLVFFLIFLNNEERVKGIFRRKSKSTGVAG